MSSTSGYAAAPAPAPAPSTQPTAPAPAAPATAPPAPAVARRPLPLLGATDLPRGLARWQAALTVCVIVWALLTVALLGNSWDRTRSGAANTAQLTRIHAIESSLFQADAIATNGFLVGGLEPADQRESYDMALQEVSRLIIESAEAQPADADALVALNHEVLRYAEQMQQARANNRQGLPVGAQYLREASEQLRNSDDGILALLENLTEANAARADGSLGGHWTVLTAIPGLALLVLLGWFHHQVARLFRRRINVGMAAAGALVAAGTIAAVAVTWSLAHDAGQLKEGEFATATAVAGARTAANDAKSNESLRLIARGSGAAFEEDWAAADERVRELLGDRSELSRLWDEYRTGHAAIVAADEGGDWDAAVQLAVDREPGSATAHFAEFDDTAEATIAAASTSVTTTLRSGSWRAALMVIATFLVAGAALTALSWGVAQRRKEFA